MKIDSVTSIAVITADDAASRALYVDTLGLPLHQLDGDYFASEDIAGCRHFGVWPLAQAAEACFGTRRWPDDVARPQVSVEFEVTAAEEVSEAAQELRARGYDLLHDAKTEPWGQVVARLLSPEGAVVGISYAPSLHEQARGASVVGCRDRDVQVPLVASAEVERDEDQPSDASSRRQL